MDLKLDANGDLDISTLDLQITSLDGRDDLRQQIQIRLQFFQGEWFLNTDFGMPYFQTIFRKGITKDVVDNIIRQQVLAIDGVVAVENLTSTLNFRTRDYTCTFKAVCDDGQTVEVTI